jgi:hypothetical protein
MAVGKARTDRGVADALPTYVDPREILTAT